MLNISNAMGISIPESLVIALLVTGTTSQDADGFKRLIPIVEHHPQDLFKYFDSVQA